MWERRRLHNKKLHSLYRSPNVVRVIKSRRLRWAEHVARTEEDRSAFKMVTGNPTGKRSLGMHRQRWGYNIIMDLRKISIDTSKLVDSAHYELFSALVN